MRKFLFLMCFALLFATVCAQPTDSFINEAIKRYPMLEVCELPDFPGKTLCGTLEVFEDYRTNQGKKIPIDVIVIPANTANPDKSAFTLHWGGNGSSAKDKIWYFREESFSNNIRSTRDIVLLDDRGTGASNIRCSAMDSMQPYSYAFVYDKDLIRECLNEVEGKIRLELYNTPGVVKDYDLVRQWLNLEQFDFYGISYGVRVGLEYMRNYPKRIRTLTVQGCVPPGFDYVNEMDIAIQEQLEILFQRCKDDAICNEYYPEFREKLYEIRDRLSDEPYQFEYELESGGSKEITVDDLLFRRLIGHLILNGNVNESLPMLVNRAYEGNYVPLIIAGGSLNLDMPVFLSQFCPEEIDRFDYKRAEINSKRLFTQGAIAEEKKTACELWTQMPTAEWLNEPLTGESPILILTGENDANTPIKMGEQIKDAFPNRSRHIILPYQGHGGSERDCRFNIIAQFVNSKELQSVDTTCLTSVSQTSFVYELNLSDGDFEKFAGAYSTDDPDKILKLFKQNGINYLVDEFSQWTGPSQLLYKGDNTFGLLDCEQCKIIVEMDQGVPTLVKRVYKETVVFKPKK